MNFLKFLQKSTATPWGLLFLGVVIAALSSGVWLIRGEWLYPEQLQTSNSFQTTLHNTAVGQTFVSSQAGLTAIDVQLDLPPELVGSLTLHLRDNPTATQDIQESVALLRNDGWVRFPLEAIPDSRSRYYYFFIEPSAASAHEAVTVYAGPPDAYPDGALYLNGRPQESQLAFRLAYNRPAMLYDLCRGVLFALPRAAAILLVFTLPGWAMLILFQMNGRRPFIHHWLEGSSASVGLSMALYPILFLGANVLNWQPGALLIWLIVSASALLLLWHYRPWRLRWTHVTSGARVWAASDNVWADSALILVLLAAAVGRLFMVRGLQMPFWHDSVQHAAIAQRIVETGGLFQSWLPYSPHTTFSFHFGYHLNTAVFSWVTGLSTPQAMLWGGQAFNLFAVFTLYALAYRLHGAWGGVMAVFTVGLFTQFPLYYANWGRYPQVMGQAILPTAAWWTWVTLQSNENRLHTNLAWIVGGGSLIASSILSYYPMSFHYLAFVAAAILVYAQSGRDLLNWRKGVTLAGTAGVTLIMMLPWIGNLLAPMVKAATDSTAVTPVTVSLWDQIAPLPPTWLIASQLLLLLLGTLAMLWWGRQAALPTLWFWMLAVLPIVKLTPLPGAGIISDLTVHTSLYLPITLVWAVFGGRALTPLPRQWQQALLLPLLIAAVLQLPKMPQIVVHQWDLSSRPDMEAAVWINETLPADAFFLINGFEYKATPAASDAGWWLPLLTGRQTTIPPQYATFVEKPILDGYRQITTQLVEDLLAQPPTSAEGKALICQFPYPITHLYIGQKRGMLRGTAPDVTPERPLLPPEALLQDPDFTLLYQQDRVLIFAFNRDVCAHE